MLIDLNTIKTTLNNNGIFITGALHVGAHECEEMSFYTNFLRILPSDIIWIEANNNIVIKQQNKNIPNVFYGVISDKDDDLVTFNIANNGQSSSILEFGTHSTEHPHVLYVDKIKQKTITLNSFFKNNSLDPSKYNFWNFDIQGAELMALKGGENYIKYVDAMYLEVNEKELYKNCALIGEIDKYLLNSGFKRVLTEMTEFGWGDALYIRQK
jgi:FkbM family methyltransferase